MNMRGAGFVGVAIFCGLVACGETASDPAGGDASAGTGGGTSGSGGSGATSSGGSGATSSGGSGATGGTGASGGVGAAGGGGGPGSCVEGGVDSGVESAIASSCAVAVVRVSRIDGECSGAGGTHITFDVLAVGKGGPVTVVHFGGHAYYPTPPGAGSRSARSSWRGSIPLASWCPGRTIPDGALLACPQPTATRTPSSRLLVKPKPRS